MSSPSRHGKPIIGVLAGWQFYKTATNLSYLAPVYRGISKAAQNLECNLLLGCGMGPSASPNDPFRPAWPFSSQDQDFVPIGPWNTNGLIIATPLHSQVRSEYIHSLMENRHPILFIGSGESGPTIVADNETGVDDAVRHLVQHGHRKIAFIAGSPDDMSGDSGERLRAFQSLCRQYEIDNDTSLVAYGWHMFNGGYHAMRQLLSLGKSFSAVLASNDESALGAMKALEESGVRVPDDIAVIGFDNRLEGAIQVPGLSSIHIPLFDMGYQAVELLLDNIERKIPLAEKVKVETRLVIRQSCGCGTGNVLAGAVEQLTSVSADNQTIYLSKTISATIMNQAHSLTQEECLNLSTNLVDTYLLGIRSGDRSAFQLALRDALQRTEAGGDDAHLWQEAVTLLEKGFKNFTHDALLSSAELLDDARHTISESMQRQHRLYVMQERWTSSRLSLLTAELLTALDESRIYEILAKHLPEMEIHTAMLALFDADEDDPWNWITVRDALIMGREPIRLTSQDFPSTDLLDESCQYTLTLIPVNDQSRQLGFMIFDTDHLELYGAIVQQLGSAFNTVRLYRQATEGRRLAEEADRLKSRFLSTISHELRTPLNLIVGLSGIVLQETEERESDIPGSTQKDIQRINAYAQHLSGLIGDVIDLASLDAGQLRLNKELINLGETLQMVVESGSQLSSDKGLTWQANVPITGPWVWGDQTRLRQVVLNLVNNAIKFTGHGEVSLLLASDDRHAIISVRDSGLGIPLEEKDSIFDAFRRSERSIALGYPGLGLGLSICKMLVEMHGGNIELHSTGIEGEGSTFSIVLPVVQPPPDQKQNQVESRSDQKSVLVLSSRIGANEKLCELLTQRNLGVREATMKDPLDLQTALKKNIPDVIVLDVTVQSDLNWATLKAIKENRAIRYVPTLLYSSSDTGEALVSLDYLTKPIGLDELTRVLDRHWVSVDSDHPARTFLVVDDEPNTRALHARIVQSQSELNRIVLASNGHEALRTLRQEKVDLVLLDLQMPQMDGFEVLEAMREDERTREIPVIVVTGKALTEEDMKRLNRGVAVILKKGLFTPEETAAHIGAILEQKHNIGVDAQRLVRQAMVYIHEHYGDPISRQTIARHINVSEDYLTFCFRRELGTTPVKYIQRYRVNQAKLLLKDSQKTIMEVALGVGFSDSGYFSRIFHREVGMSPDQFRRS